MNSGSGAAPVKRVTRSSTPSRTQTQAVAEICDDVKTRNGIFTVLDVEQIDVSTTSIDRCVQPKKKYTCNFARPEKKTKDGTATHNIMAFAQPLLVVGCTNRFALCTKQRIGLGCAKGQ